MASERSERRSSRRSAKGSGGSAFGGSIARAPEVWCGDCASRMAREPEFFELWWRTWPVSVRKPVDDSISGIQSSFKRLGSSAGSMRPKQILAIRVRLARDMAYRKGAAMEELFEEKSCAGGCTSLERNLVRERMWDWDAAVRILDRVWERLARDHDKPVWHALGAALEYESLDAPRNRGWQSPPSEEDLDMPAWLRLEPSVLDPADETPPTEHTNKDLSPKRFEPVSVRVRHVRLFMLVVLAILFVWYLVFQLPALGLF
jgi:hypothetical protein